MATEQERIGSEEPRETTQSRDTAHEDIEGRTEEVKREVKSRAEDVAREARRKAAGFFDSQRHVLARKFENLSRALMDTADRLDDENEETLALYLDRAAERIERLGRRLDRGDVDTMFDDAQRVARNNPALFMGGAVALGVIASRLFKSAGDEGDLSGVGEDGDIEEAEFQEGDLGLLERDLESRNPGGDVGGVTDRISQGGTIPPSGNQPSAGSFGSETAFGTSTSHIGSSSYERLGQPPPAPTSSTEVTPEGPDTPEMENRPEERSIRNDDRQ